MIFLLKKTHKKHNLKSQHNKTFNVVQCYFLRRAHSTEQTPLTRIMIIVAVSFISQLTGAVISLTGLLFDLTMTSIENLLLQTHLNQTTIALNPTSIFQYLSLLPHTGLLGTLLTLTAHHLLLNFPVFQSFHMLKMQTSCVTFCAQY